MSKLPAVSARRRIRLLEDLGFRRIRCRGSHRFFLHSDGRATVVPDHSGEDPGRGLIRAILRDIDVSREQYERLLIGS